MRVVATFVLIWIVVIGIGLWMMNKPSSKEEEEEEKEAKESSGAGIWARRVDARDTWTARLFFGDATSESTIVVPVDSAHAHREYDAIRVAPGLTVRLYRKTTRDFRNWPLPTVVRTVEARETTVEVETPVFTHLRVVARADAPEPTEDVCNPMRIATVERVWPEACLPEGLRDANRCGVDTYGHKVGNYLGLPTRCNAKVGDTLDADGFGVFRDPVSGLLALSQNPESDLETLRYPVAVPVFLTNPATTTTTTTTTTVEEANASDYYTVSRARVPGAACERTFLCSAPNARALREMLDRVHNGHGLDALLATCEPHTDTC